MATSAQGWVLLGLLGVAFATIIGLVQWGMRSGFKVIEAQIDGKFTLLIQRIDTLDRDVQALTNKVFRQD